MRMGWISHNSVGDQNFLTQEIFDREFQVVLFTQFCYYRGYIKLLKNETK